MLEKARSYSPTVSQLAKWSRQATCLLGVEWGVFFLTFEVGSLAIPAWERCSEPGQDWLWNQKPQTTIARMCLGGSFSQSFHLWSHMSCHFLHSSQSFPEPTQDLLLHWSFQRVPGGSLTEVGLAGVAVYRYPWNHCIFSGFSPSLQWLIPKASRPWLHLNLVSWFCMLMFKWNVCDLSFLFSFPVIYQWCCRIQSSSRCHESNWLQTRGDSNSI